MSRLRPGGSGFLAPSGGGGGVGSVDIGSSIPSGTDGSLLFVDGGNLSEGNNDLFWHNANDQLGIGTTTPGQSIVTVAGNIGANPKAIHVKEATNEAILVLEGGSNSQVILADASGTANERIIRLVNFGDTTQFDSLNDSLGSVETNILSLKHNTGNIGMGTAPIDNKKVSISFSPTAGATVNDALRPSLNYSAGTQTGGGMAVNGQVAFSGTVGQTGTDNLAVSAVGGTVNHSSSSTLEEVAGVVGVFSGTGAFGTVTSANGQVGVILNTGSGTITNASGFRVTPAVNSGGGTITNNYGMVIEAQTVGGNNSNVRLERGAIDDAYLELSDGTDVYKLFGGSGTPETKVAADIGSLYIDGTNGDLYVKTTDTANTGWSTFSRDNKTGQTIADADATLTNEDEYIIYSSITASRTVNLPAANSVTAYKEYFVKDGSGSVTGVNTIVVDPNGAETIDGAATATISIAYGFLKFLSNGSEWLITSQ